ncbi:UNVERIFIED_CONTAM: hypothetical protein FKN15_040111 [Acipenser sinensis]
MVSAPLKGGVSDPVNKANKRSAGSRYWEQFGSAPPEGLDSAPAERKRRRNLQLVGCCVLVMLASLGAHYFGFR